MTMPLAVILLREQQMYVPQGLWKVKQENLENINSLSSKSFKYKAIKLMGFFLIKNY